MLFFNETEQMFDQVYNIQLSTRPESLSVWNQLWNNFIIALAIKDKNNLWKDFSKTLPNSDKAIKDHQYMLHSFKFREGDCILRRGCNVIKYNGGYTAWKDKYPLSVLIINGNVICKFSPTAPFCLPFSHVNLKMICLLPISPPCLLLCALNFYNYYNALSANVV